MELSFQSASAVVPARLSLLTFLTYHSLDLLHDWFPNGRGSQKLLESFPHPRRQSLVQSGSSSALPGSFLL